MLMVRCDILEFTGELVDVLSNANTSVSILFGSILYVVKIMWVNDVVWDIWTTLNFEETA